MNKKFLSAILFGALMVSSTGTFVSCKDYDDDIDEINNKISGIESTIAELQKKIGDGAYVKSITPTTDGFTVTMSDGSTTSITVKNGQDGKDGTEWTISADGYWECNGEKTTVKAVGEKGEAGQQEVKKENGKWYLWNAETGAFEEISVDAPATANVPYYFEDPSDPNYTYLVIYDENGQNEKTLRLPMTSGLAQIVLVGEELNVLYHTFNGAHFKNGKATGWNGAKELPEKGEYLLTTDANAIYVQVVPSNYDISNLDFKLVNSKGDEAPIVLGTPEPCKEAIPAARANVSESGVYAISFTLPEMTDEVLKAYDADIKDKALSLVASETVRSTYGYKLEVKGTTSSDNLTFGSVNGNELTTADQPYTVKLDTDADKVYDSFLTMKDAKAKADSVRYGMSIDGMTISYTGEMPANKKIGFTINQINANAIVNSEKAVDVTFNSQEVKTQNITLDALEPHKAVAIRTVNGSKVNKQYVDVDFAPYFAQITPEEGDRLMWNQDVKGIVPADIEVMWTEIDAQGNMKPAVDATSLIGGVKYLTADGADKVNNNPVALKDFGQLRIQFAENYGSTIKLGNGYLVATVSIKDKVTNNVLQTVEVPFTIEEPTKEEIASWYNWNAASNYVDGALVFYASNTTFNLKDQFQLNEGIDGVELSLTEKQNSTDNKFYPNMKINRPTGVTAAKVFWTGADTGQDYWAAKNSNYTTSAQITVSNLVATDYGTYTIKGVQVELGKHILNAADLKVAIKKDITRADVITFSNELKIASKQNEYIRLSDEAFTPNAGSFFGTFALKDYMGRSYVLGSTTTIKVVEVGADGSYDDTFTGASTAISADKVEYTYTLGTDATQKAYGIELTYIGSEEYPAGKTFKVMLQITNVNKDGSSVSEPVVVPATITIGGM